MNILFASSSFKGGGITSYAIEFIKHYMEDNTLNIIIGDDSYSPIKNKNVAIYYYEMEDLSIQNATKIIKLINNIIKPEIIINSNAKIISLITPYLNDDIKVITLSHSLRYEEADAAAFNNKYVDYIIALSNYNKLYLVKKFNISNKSKVCIVYNTVQDHPIAEQIKESKIYSEKIKIVFAGGTIPSKSPELVYKILMKLLETEYNFQFYWLGMTSPPLKKIQLFKDIRQIIPNDPRIFFTGKIKREQATEIIANANIYLSPSKREGCPMALLEALRIGTISIVSDYHNACREIISDKSNGYIINHKDVNGFVFLIRSILSNHTNFTDIYNISSNYFEKHLSFECWKNQMDKIIYSTIVNHKKRHNNFNKKKYIFKRFIWNFNNKVNELHLLFFEIFPSALFFFLFYFKKNYFK